MNIENRAIIFKLHDELFERYVKAAQESSGQSFTDDDVFILLDLLARDAVYTYVKAYERRIKKEKRNT